MLYQAFSTPEETQRFRQELIDGLGWGEAKKRLAEKIDAEIGPMRVRYETLMAHPAQLEDILQAGAQKARAIATPFRRPQELHGASICRKYEKKAEEGASGCHD